MPEKKKSTPRSSGGTRSATSNKRTGAAKKAPQKQPEKKPVNRALRNTVYGIVLLGLAVITFLSFFDGVMGVVGKGLAIAMKWSMGVTAVAIPVLLVVLAFMFFFNRQATMTRRRWCTVILYAVVSILLSVCFVDLNGMSLPDYLSLLAARGIEAEGGGTITGIFAWGLLSLFSRVGSIIVLILAILVLLVLISGVTVADLFERRNTASEDDEEDEEEPVPTPVPRRKKTTEDPVPEPAPFPTPGGRKRDFDIPEINPEEELSPADKRRLAEEQRRREEEMGYGDPTPTPEPPRHRPVLSDELIEDTKRPSRKDPTSREPVPDPRTPEEIAAQAAALMQAEADTATPPEQKKLTAEEVRKEEALVAEEVDKKSDQTIPYAYPPLSLLSYKPDENASRSEAEREHTKKLLMNALESFAVNTTFLSSVRGPTVTRYELQPNAGVKISKITNLADDIALHLAASGVRIEAPIPGRSAIGIEIPNKVASVVYLKETVSSDAFRNHKSNIAVALGKDIGGQNVCIDLAKMPHLLIAGSTGSGKSVCINTILMSILYKASPEQVQLILIDPKMVELSVYNGIPHLLIPVVTDAKKASGALTWAVSQMMDRYKLFAQKNVRNFQGYNEKLSEGEQALPQMVIVIDELADLMMVAPGQVEDSICRLAQMARAAGIHLVIATQRPSADVLTGLIKTNVPSRIAFAVSSGIDSRIILDQTGAEKLIGRGDMLYHPLGAPKPLRIQGCFVSDGEIEAVVNYVKANYDPSANAEKQQQIMNEINQNSREINAKGSKKGITGSMGGTDEDGDYVDDGDDVLLPRAVELVLKAGMASTSGLQRALGVGHARAGRLMDQMEKKGYIGPYQGSKPRDVLITPDQWNEIRATQGDDEE